MTVGALFGRAAVALTAVTMLSVPALQASATASKPAGSAAASKPAPLAARALPVAPGVRSTVAPSWQTNDTAWALAAAKGVVYVGGQFTSVRPPGDQSGTGEVARTFIAAFSARTGALKSFHPIITGPAGAMVRALAVSPDGRTLYVGGNFKHVNGVFRDNLAAFSTSTGALTSWAPTAFGTVLAITPSPAGSVIYLGGDFNQLDGVARTFAGAVTSSAGGLTALAWNPVLDNSVTSIAVARDDSRVLIGGFFTTFNGVTQNAIGSTDPNTGASKPFAATIVPHFPGCSAAVKDIIISGRIAYIAAEGTGGGCFDGDFAARVSDGALVWQNACLGATQSIIIIRGWLFKGSHAHDCAFAPGGFPQVASGTGNITHHLLDQSLADGTLGHWNPNTNGNQLGPRAMATDGADLFVGGDFTTVNGKPQQGFARFQQGFDTTTPGRPGRPVVTSTSAGVDSVSFSAVSDSDVGTLTYSIYRDGRRRPIATLQATSWPWALPVLHYRDAGLARGSMHIYRVRAGNGTRSSAKSPASAPVTVSSKSPRRSYSRTVLGDQPSFFWTLGQRTGSIATDASAHGFNGSYEPGTTKGVAGPITGSRARATAFNGRAGIVTSARASASPMTFSIEAWFRTTTDRGGKLIGFGNAQTGGSSRHNNQDPGSTSFDRHIYLMNDGQLVFGVWTGQPETIETPNVYNDGGWHYVVATLSLITGMSLYVDGQLVGTNPNTSALASNGFWRVGGDNLNGWNLDPIGRNSQGTDQPNSFYFNGVIGDVAVYPVALSAARVAAHYAANARSH